MTYSKELLCEDSFEDEEMMMVAFPLSQAVVSLMSYGVTFRIWPECVWAPRQSWNLLSS